jgi:hypothetical protein
LFRSSTGRERISFGQLDATAARGRYLVLYV